MLLFSKMKLRRDVLKKTLWLNTVWRRTTWVVTCTHIFLSHVSILTRDIDIANLSVCLSVRPSLRYVPVPDENGLTYRQFFSPYGSPIILVLPKFHPNRSISRRVIAFPIFCNMAAVRHLEYEFCYSGLLMKSSMRFDYHVKIWYRSDIPRRRYYDFIILPLWLENA